VAAAQTLQRGQLKFPVHDVNIYCKVYNVKRQISPDQKNNNPPAVPSVLQTGQASRAKVAQPATTVAP